VRDPSYLYHWLMSFPYQLISAITANQAAQIIFLRLLNVALFAYGMVLYRRIVRRLGASRALTNALFAVFVLIPVVPFLAAHINYDNLFFVAVPLALLLTMHLVEGFRDRRVDAALLLELLVVACLACLIKYPFLPVLLTVGGFLSWRLWRDHLLSAAGLRSFVASFAALSRLRQVVLVVACLLSFGLFVERYAANLITYHDPVPACNAVISQDECAQYGPFWRDYQYARDKPASFHPHVYGYAWQWLYGMWYRLFFAINYDYATRPPLLVISTLCVVLAAWALVGTVLRFRRLFAGHAARQLVGWVTLGYILVLFVDGFSAYSRTGQPVAINGRYLIPFLPFLFAFGGLAWTSLLHGRLAVVKTATAAAVLIVLVLQGGGALTFVVRSSDSWYWNNGLVRSVNRGVRNAVSPVILGKNVY
jgi:hypothetical protein